MKRRAPREGNFDKDEPGLDYQDWVQQVNECARALDEGVGQLLAALDETGQRANTLVVFTADQGFALGEHGMSIKLAPYDAAIASPLIVSQPGTLARGQVCRQPVNSADLVATFCAGRGSTVPWTLHGHDLSPLLERPGVGDLDASRCSWSTSAASTARTPAAIPSGPKLTEVGGVPWWVLLRDGRFKYIRTLAAGRAGGALRPRRRPRGAAQPGRPTPSTATGSRPSAPGCAAELRRTEAPFVDAMPAPRPPGR